MRALLRPMLAALAIIFLIGASSVYAEQKATVRTGYLTCHVDSGWGFIFGSSRKVKCAYSMTPGDTEDYSGRISNFGADIGYLQSAVILWAVIAPTTDLGPGALAGDYAGATASVALGVGAGVNVLLGGIPEIDRAPAGIDRRPERPERRCRDH